MKEIILSWISGLSAESQTIRPDRLSKNPGKFIIGRDPDKCDVVLPSVTKEDLTVSKVHIEIYFDPNKNNFYLRNLKGANNPPKVYGHGVHNENPVLIDRDGTIFLGEREIQVTIKQTKEEPTIANPLICPHCKRGYTYEQGAKMNGRCQNDGYPLHGNSLCTSVEKLL